MPEVTISASLAASLLNFAVEAGADRETLLEGCGLREAELVNPDGRIAISNYGRLIGTAIALTSDGALVMRHAAATTIDALSVVGLVVDHTESLEEWVDQLNRYSRLIADVEVGEAEDRYRLVDEDGELWLVDHLPEPNAAPAAIEDTFTRIIASFRNFAPQRTFALEAEVTYPRPDHADAYAEIWQVPVRFAARRNAIRICDEWRGARLSPVNAYARDLFRRHADALLAELATKSTVRARLERWMMVHIQSSEVSIDRAARQLGMSRQTLYRRLKDEGLTFVEVHDGLRDRIACELLGAPETSVGEVAHLLGFSEPSSFVRAFRRWTGISPGKFRAGTMRTVARPGR